MKKTGFGKRLLCMLLALTMIMSIVPGAVLAASVGDVVFPRGTGLLAGSDIDVNDTISWPIKIYDYLNDGMMFEFSGSDFGDASYTLPSTGGYTNAANNPFVQGTTLGVDYTSVNGYFSNVSNQTPTYAMSEWGDKAAYAYPIDDNATEATRSVVAATGNSPMCLRYTGTSSSGEQTSRSYGWISNFAKDNGRYYSLNDVRYVVMVYRTPSTTTSGTRNGQVQFYVAASRTADYQADYTWFTQTRGLSHIDITDLCYDNYLTSTDDSLPQFGWQAEGVRNTGMLTSKRMSFVDSTEWTYAVVDLMDASTSASWSADGKYTNIMYSVYDYFNPGGLNADETAGTNLIGNNGDYLTGNCIAAVGMACPIDANGEELDISHIAYFGSLNEAKQFGEDAAAFDKVPGDYSGDTVTLTHSTKHQAPTVYDKYLSTFVPTSTYGTSSSRLNGTWYPYNYFGKGTGAYMSKSYDGSTYTYVLGCTENWKKLGNITVHRIYSWNYSTTILYPTVWAFIGNKTSSNYDGNWVTTDVRNLASYQGADKSSKAISDIRYIRYITLVYETLNIDDLEISVGFGNDDDKIGLFCGEYWNTRGAGSDSGYVEPWTKVPESSHQSLSSSSTYKADFVTVTIDLLEYVKAAGHDSLEDLDSDMWKLDGIFLSFWKFNKSPATTYDSSYYYDSFNLAYCDFFTDQETAELYGSRVQAYCNAPDVSSANSVTTTLDITSTTPTKYYLGGNNKSFGFAHPNTGGKLYDDDGNVTDYGWGTNGSPNANNTNTNGYYAYGIGVPFNYNLSGGSYSGYDTRRSAAPDYGYTLAESVYILSTESFIGRNYTTDSAGNKVVNYADIPNMGYQLYSTLRGNTMLCTVGLLEGSLVTYTGIDGESYRVPTYKEESVYYIAELLNNCLCVPEYNCATQSWGPQYLYNFVQGTPHVQFGVDADGKATGTAMDFASALRTLLGITFTSTNYNATTQANTFYQPNKADLGTWAKTLAKTNVSGKNQLIGPFLDCAPYIETFYDAAYYMLNNLFVDNSYNQVQDDFNYLRLSKATLEDGVSQAYVFDAGFGDADGNSGVVYDVDNKVIGLSTATHLREVVYMIQNGVPLSTTIPFLPVYDGYGPNGSPNMYDDGVQNAADNFNTYENRNYNYVLQANGEFIYYELDDLYFDFAGDDDVYLFVNGELVMDIGGGHGITAVEFLMNEYVSTAREVIEALCLYDYCDDEGNQLYSPIMSDAAFQALFIKIAGSIDGTLTAEADLNRDGKYASETFTYEELLRWHHLNLLDGRAYPIDFYYMERHGTGANMRILTNIVMTDPSLNTTKNAYQLDENDEMPLDKEGNPVPVGYGAQVDDSKRIMYEFSATNNGNTKLYNLSFMDAKIGVNLTPENGLQIYGKGTSTTFTTTDASTSVTVAGLDGMVVLDGTSYTVTNSGWSTTVAAGRHTLNLYQVGEETLFNDVVATINLGGTSQVTPTATSGVYTLELGKTNLVNVAGARVTNIDGEPLQVSDLVFKVDGYASSDEYDADSPMDTIEIYLEDNDALKAFLHNLESPDTESEYDYYIPLYSGDGLWQHATVTVSGIWYTFSAEDSNAKMFQNTVYTYAYEDKLLDEDSVVIKSQDQHKVYMMGGEPAYYQWAGHTLHLQFDMIWKDVYETCTEENSPLYDYKTTIQAIEAYEAANYTVINSNDEIKTWVNSRYATNYARFTVALCNAKGQVFDADGNVVDEEGEVIDTKDEYVTWDPDLYLATITYETTGVHCFYLKVTHSQYPNAPLIIPVSVYSADTKDVTYVLDYGVGTMDLNTNGQLFAGDKLLGNLNGITAMLMGIYLDEPFYYDDNLSQTDSAGFSGNPTGGNKYYDYGFNGNKAYVHGQRVQTFTATNGKYVGTNDFSKFIMSKALPSSGISLTYDGSKYTLGSDLSYAPTAIMDEARTFYLGLSVHEEGLLFGGNSSQDYDAYRTLYFDYSIYAINPGNQVTMYKAVTIVPANVVYYEDDFAGISYTGDMVQSSDKTAGTFVHHGNGSGSLTQSLDNTGVYGQDSIYQQNTNTTMSGNSMTTIKITDTSKVMSFGFTGTGFELVGQTNATDSAIMVVEILDSNGNQTHYFPVITEFDNGNDGGNDAINQVPLVRLNDLDYGSYTVNIYGNPSYDFSKWDGNMDTIASCVIPTYLYVDGVRIFQPMGDSSEFYTDVENGVTFTSVRNQIVAGSVGVAMLTGDGLSMSTGTATWTENRVGIMDNDGNVSYTSNQVASADDYLIKGPNNEVYMQSFGSNSALVMYVMPDGSDTESLQIAVRALDYGLFTGVGNSKPDMMLELGIFSEGEYQWQQIANVCSSTEQYYDIPLADCPVMGDGSYQVVLRAVNTTSGQPAMVSYTMMKYVGLELVTDTFEAVTKSYVDGVLTCLEHNENSRHHEDGKCVYCGEVICEECAEAYANARMRTVSTVSSTCDDAVEGEYVESGWNLWALAQQMSATAVNEGERVEIGDNDDEEVVEDTTLPELALKYASLSFEEEIHYNLYFTAENLDDVVEMGLLVFESFQNDATVLHADQIIPQYCTDGSTYMAQTAGVAAKNMGDTYYFRAYAKLSNGRYVYSAVEAYSAVKYAESILAKSQSEQMKSLVVSMLNFGAEAQLYFGYNTNRLMNAGLTEEQQALVQPYDQDTMPDVGTVDAEKNPSFVKRAFTDCYVTASFDSAFALNYYFTTWFVPEGEVMMYYWTAEDYANADVLEPETATGAIVMTPTGEENQYFASLSGIAAKEMGDTFYVGGIYNYKGMVYHTNMINYSMGRYCDTIANREGSAQQDLSMATAVYGACAKAYFDSL